MSKGNFNHFYLVPKGTDIHEQYFSTEDHEDTPFKTFIRIFKGLWGMYEFRIVEEDLLLACEKPFKNEYVLNITEEDFYNQI